ncbi:MAG: type II secretion system protein [Candidatus Saccharimonadales bacterium]
MHLKLKNRKGFTIIEIMIVLAIAGLIMLIVFLAVPALQRTSRNTSRKNDDGNFNSALSTWVSNNNGTLPGMETGAFVQNTCNTDATSIANSIKLGYYTTANVTCANASGATVNSCATAGSGCGVGTSTSAGTENIILDEGAVCASPQPTPGTAGAMTTTTGATTRSYVTLYMVETGAAPQAECTGG